MSERPELPNRPGLPERPAVPAVSATSAASAASAEIQPYARRPKKNQGALLPVQRALTAAELASFAAVEAEMGGRGRLVAVLATAQLPPKLHAVLGRIADPRNDQEALGQICAAGNVSLTEIMRVFQDAARTRGQMLAIVRMAEKIPDVAASVMEDAVSGLKVCPRCLGAKFLDAPQTDNNPEGRIPCPSCGARGEVYHQPDHEVQKTALRMAGLLDAGRGPGVNVNLLQQQINANASDGGGYDQLMEGLDMILYGKGRDRVTPPPPIDDSVVDGDVIAEDAGF